MLKNLGLVSANGLLMFARIIEVAAVHGQDLQTVAMRYALERFLARVFAADAPKVLAVDGTAAAILSSDTVTLKGGLTMFLAEGVHPLEGRSTSDADFHVRPSENGNHIDQFVRFLEATLGRQPNGFDDGVLFDIPTLKVERVKDGNVPGGKVTVTAQIGRLALKIRSDLAFDARPVHERAVVVDYPSIVPGGIVPSVNVRHTPWEYTVADKVQAMVRHGAKNYRLRDYYDLYVILRNGKVDMDLLPEAMEHTFGLYGSEMPACADDIAALTDAFAAEKTARWDSERETKRYGDRVPDLAEVVAYLRDTLDPVLLGMSAAPRPF